MSTGILPSSQSGYLVNTLGMNDREKEILKIKARMKELGYNPRSLSMKAFNTPDRVRNLFEGKAKSWRADTYKGIMAILWPDQAPPKESPKEIEIGFLRAIEGIIAVLYSKNLVKKQDLETVFNSFLRDFRKRDQLGAAEVMDQILDFVHSGLSESDTPLTEQSRQPLPAQSKKQKIADPRTSA